MHESVHTIRKQNLQNTSVFSCMCLEQAACDDALYAHYWPNHDGQISLTSAISTTFGLHTTNSIGFKLNWLYLIQTILQYLNLM